MVKGVHETQSGAQSEAAAQVPPHATGAATVTSLSLVPRPRCATCHRGCGSLVVS
jgi:hypothetical protein